MNDTIWYCIISDASGPDWIHKDADKIEFDENHGRAGNNPGRAKD
jgi:hypothetical protein